MLICVHIVHHEAATYERSRHMAQRRVIIIGAAGRDFHNFNTRYRDDESVKVVAFTAEQIPGIDDRTYPARIPAG